MNVSFPALGWDFEIDRVAFTFFDIPVYWYGIIIALGFIAGLSVAAYAAGKLGLNSDIVLDLAICCAPFAIICARLYYVIFKFENYSDNIWEVFNLRAGGLAIYGGIIGAVISAWVYSRIKKKNLLLLADIGAIGLITGQMIGRWGNFFNQEAFGSNTNLPWGMTGSKIVNYLSGLKEEGIDVDPTLPVHPTFLYESLWSLMVLVILLVILKKYSYHGQMFFAYASLYGLGRFWIEGLRTDSLMIGDFRISQIVALVSFVLFGFLYFYFLRKKKCEKFTEN